MKRPVLLGILVAAAASVAPALTAADTPVTFAPAQLLQAGSQSVSVALADLNGDGKLDLVTANFGSGDVTVLIGNGNGGFAPAKMLAGGGGDFSVAVGDLNRDGKPDLAVANISSIANTVSVFLGDGSGGFGPAANYLTGGYNPRGVAIGDLDGDGNPDLAVTNEYSNTLSVLLGNGTGTFGTATTYATGTSPGSVAIGDLTRDGNLDVVVTNMDSASLSLFPGNGSGSLGTPATLPVGPLPVSVTIGDVNGDGRSDLVTADAGSTKVSLLLANGQGGFDPATRFDTGTAPYSVAIADLNGDGNVDLAVANIVVRSVSVLLGDGHGGFGAPADFSAGATSAPFWIAAGDLNGDGKPDLAVANNSTQGNISILLNTTGTTPNAEPIGNHEGQEGTRLLGECVAEGWAEDPDTPAPNVTVRVLVDGHQVATAVADQFRQDLLDAGIGGDGTAGFAVDLSGLMSSDAEHEIRVQARDLQTREWFDIGNTPRHMTCTQLLGFHDGNAGVVRARAACIATGWAFDADTPTGPRVLVRVKVDGREVAETTANLFRQDVLDAGFGDGYSGWVVGLSRLMTPNRPHVITAEARDTGAEIWVPLLSTDLSLTCMATPTS